MNNASFVDSFTGAAAAGVASLDPPLIQQTKSEIRTLAGEIAKLAHAALEPAEFYRGFLPRLVTAMGAVGAAVWQTSTSLRNHGLLDSSDETPPGHGLQLLAQHCFPSALLDRANKPTEALIAPSESHRKILECVIAGGAPILVPPQTVSIEADRPTNPLDDSIIVIPVRIEDDVDFVLEVVQSASGGPAAQRGYLRFVAQMAELMSDYLRRQSLREHGSRATRLQQFEFWLSAVAQADTPASQLRNVADGLAELLDSQQVFIVRGGHRPKVLAASDLDNFDPRSETIMAAQLVERFLQRESKAREMFLDLQAWRVGEQRLTCVSKLYELMASDRLVRLRMNEQGNVVALLALAGELGALPAEMRRVASSLFGLVDLHATQSRWLLKWWPFRTSLRTGSKPLRSTLQLWSMRGVLALLATVIAFFPVPQQITTTAVLAPKEKNCYYAPYDATVIDVIVAERENKPVRKNDTLLKLESLALNQQISRLEAEQAANAERQYNLSLALPEADRGSYELFSINSEFEQLKLKIATNEDELEVLESEREKKLSITALEDGELTSWDIANRLQGRPVARGELLLSTYALDTEWELQVSVPEHRVGLVSDALGRSATRTVPMRFSLISYPNVQMEGGLTWMADQTTRNAAGANVVLSRAAVVGELPLKKEGAIARVTIDCGRVPAIWLVTRDAYWACVSRLKMIW